MVDLESRLEDTVVEWSGGDLQCEMDFCNSANQSGSAGACPSHDSSQSQCAVACAKMNLSILAVFLVFASAVAYDSFLVLPNIDLVPTTSLPFSQFSECRGLKQTASPAVNAQAEIRGKTGAICLQPSCRMDTSSQLSRSDLVW